MMQKNLLHTEKLNQLYLIYKLLQRPLYWFIFLFAARYVIRLACLLLLESAHEELQRSAEEGGVLREARGGHHIDGLRVAPNTTPIELNHYALEKKTLQS